MGLSGATPRKIEAMRFFNHVFFGAARRRKVRSGSRRTQRLRWFQARHLLCQLRGKVQGSGGLGGPMT